MEWLIGFCLAGALLVGFAALTIIPAEKRAMTLLGQLRESRSKEERRLRLERMLFSLGPDCLTNDEAMAIGEGATVPEQRTEHVAGCRYCQAFIDAAERKA